MAYKLLLYPQVRDIEMAYKPINTKERIMHRLKISKGHLEKVIKMVDEEAYCIDVLHQVNAIESNLKKSGNLLLEKHLRTCVADSISEGNAEKSISELMEVFQRNK